MHDSVTSRGIFTCTKSVEINSNSAFSVLYVNVALTCKSRLDYLSRYCECGMHSYLPCILTLYRILHMLLAAPTSDVPQRRSAQSFCCHPWLKPVYPFSSLDSGSSILVNKFQYPFLSSLTVFIQCKRLYSLCAYNFQTLCLRFQ